MSEPHSTPPTPRYQAFTEALKKMSDSDLMGLDAELRTSLATARAELSIARAARNITETRLCDSKIRRLAKRLAIVSHEVSAREII